MGNLTARLRGGLALAGTGLAAATLVASGAAPATARPLPQRTVHCNISRVWHKLGPTYVETLAVSGTSCANGEKTIRAYDACRRAHGGVRGHCTSVVNGFRCREQRYNSPIQFTAKVSCTRPRASVGFAYSENT